MHKLTRRDRFYNQGGFYDSLPALRIPVVPGQSNAVDIRLKFQTAAFTNNVLGGGIASLFLFYVPNRLLWDDWTDFISQNDDYAGTFPLTATTWSAMFDRTVAAAAFPSFNCLPRRAYKLCYNQFFGNEKFESGANTWYDDITADTVITQVQTRNTEQFTSRLMVEGALATPTYDATTVPIDLNDFHRQMINARSARKAQMTGDKYVDTLRRMGVEPDWRIQNAPEFLGRIDHDCLPVKTFDTSATSTGDSVARFEGTLERTIGKKMFAEHGYIIGIFTMRPHVFNVGCGMPIDGTMRDLEDFWLADNARSQDQYDDAIITTAAGPDVFATRFGVYRNGTHVYGAGNSWAATLGAPANVDDVVYPNSNFFSTGDELGGDDVAFLNQSVLMGSTPIPATSL